MSFVTVERTNPNAVIKRLENISVVNQPEFLMQFVNKRLDELYEQIWKVTPVKTGYLRSTLRVTSNNKSESSIYFTAYYAAYVEFGTRGRTPHHYFFPNVAVAAMEIVTTLRGLFYSFK